jgi:hypothetical protein
MCSVYWCMYVIHLIRNLAVFVGTVLAAPQLSWPKALNFLICSLGHHELHWVLCGKRSRISKVTRTDVVILQEAYFHNYEYFSAYVGPNSQDPTCHTAVRLRTFTFTNTRSTTKSTHFIILTAINFSFYKKTAVIYHFYYVPPQRCFVITLTLIAFLSNTNISVLLRIIRQINNAVKIRQLMLKI